MQVRCTKRIYRGQWGRGWKFIELTPCFSSASPRRCFIGLFLLAPTKSVEFIPRNFYRANDPPFLSLPFFSPSPLSPRSFENVFDRLLSSPIRGTNGINFFPLPSFLPAQFLPIRVARTTEFLALFDRRMCIEKRGFITLLHPPFNRPRGRKKN